MKAYVLAKGDITTAIGILQYANIVTVVMTGLLSALPIGAAFLLAFCVYRWTHFHGLKNRAWKLLGVFGAALFLTAVLSERKPYDPLTDVTEAPTLWHELTAIRGLRSLAPAKNTSCPNPAKRDAG